MKWWLWMTVIILLSGCEKNVVRTDRIVPMDDPLTAPIPDSGATPLLIPNYCIFSYQQLTAVIGSSPRTVKAVLLENGDWLTQGNEIIDMLYYATDLQEPFSIFRSHFLVYYNIYGFVQTHYQDVWSLGCVYESAGVPPFTQVEFQGQVYLINTCFIWGVPPLGMYGFRVLKLYL